MADNESHLKLVNESGFPLQVALEHLVREDGPGEWKVRFVEHAWQSQDGTQAGFIDLVIQNQYDTAVMVIECKRVRDADWIFLSANGSAAKRREASAWITRYVGGSFKLFGWEHFPVNPGSPEASMCMVRGQTVGGPRPMLERVAAEVAESTEALARQERDYRSAPNSTMVRAYFSVVVTTAKLSIASYDPAEIDISKGELDKAAFEEVPYVRFRKQLRNAAAASFAPDDYHTEGFVSNRENTVFIVNSDHVRDFLIAFELDNRAFNRFL